MVSAAASAELVGILDWNLFCLNSYAVTSRLFVQLALEKLKPFLKGKS